VKDIIGIVLSFGFVFAVLGVAQLLLSRRVVSAPVSRKIVHIGVSHWWLIAWYFFTRPLPAAVGPVCFIVLNYISYRAHLFRAMEDAVPRKNLGTIYFPISLLVLVILTFGGPVPLFIGAIGVLIMGYGDGVAALVGERYGTHHFTLFGQTKSAEGVAAMFAASFAVVLLVTAAGSGVSHPAAELLFTAAATAAFASLIEAVTPFGIDNFTVPILTSLFYYVVFA